MISLQQQSGHADHEIVRDYEGEGDGWGGKKKGTEDEREICWLDGGEGEMRAGQFSAQPEAKWRTERRVPPAPCSADPINIIPILEIC